jgi:hypothetical protein
MKLALKALEYDPCEESAIRSASFYIKEAIEQAEKQEPVEIKHPLIEQVAKLIDENQQLRAELKFGSRPPATIKDNSQNWAGMDGAVAWHLIDRHADNWADIGKMMNEWLAANTHVTDIDMSQERVDETVKQRHEIDPDLLPVVLIDRVDVGGRCHGMLRKGANADQVIGAPLYMGSWAGSARAVVASHAKRLALELECLLLSCNDSAAVSKWWDSAHEALDAYRADIDRLYPPPPTRFGEPVIKKENA